MTVHSRTAVNPAGLMKFASPVSQAMRAKADEYLFVAGQVALDENGNVVGAGDVRAQVRKTFQNIETVLQSVGASFDNVVDFTTYLVGRDALPPFMQTRTELFQGYFPNGNYPSNTLILVSGLFKEELRVEIHVIAAL